MNFDLSVTSVKAMYLSVSRNVTCLFIPDTVSLLSLLHCEYIFFHDCISFCSHVMWDDVNKQQDSCKLDGDGASFMIYRNGN